MITMVDMTITTTVTGDSIAMTDVMIKMTALVVMTNSTSDIVDGRLT